MNNLEALKNAIVTVPDFPIKGVMFRDITPILLNGELISYVTKTLAEEIKTQRIDAIAGIESRGFLFGMTIASELELGFIPIRKQGKLPRPVASALHELEYGFSQLEVHIEDVKPGMRIHIHDDLLATGGTAEAAARILLSLGVDVVSFSFIVELAPLHGRKKIEKITNLISTLVIY